VADLPRSLAIPSLVLGVAACSARPLPLPGGGLVADLAGAPPYDMRVTADSGAIGDMSAPDLHDLPDLGPAVDQARAPDLACAINGPPRAAPTKLSFSDTDPSCNELGGTVVVSHATSECDVTSYVLYWGASATVKLAPTPIATLAATGNDVSYALVNQPLPAGANYLLAYAANHLGENATPAAVAIVESTWSDISAGQGAESGYTPSAVLDSVNGKLLVVTDDNSRSHQPALFRCNLDGTGCAYVDISAGRGPQSEFAARAVIDTANGKLLDVPGDAMFRCNLDGTGCAFVPLSAGRTTASEDTPAAVIDPASNQLLVVLGDASGTVEPVLYRCNLDGSGCTFSDISAGHNMESARNPSAVIDSANGKLLVVTQDEGNANKPALFRCNLDGTACAYRDISAGQGAGSGNWPVALVDSANNKLLVVTSNEVTGYTLALFRCNLDGTACTYRDISAGQPAQSGLSPTAVIDAAGGQLLVATLDAANDGKPALYRCNLDGTACTYRDISAGRGPVSGAVPSAVLDATHRRLLVVTEDSSNQQRPSLFSVCLP
jgi:hypothetical protein